MKTNRNVWVSLTMMVVGAITALFLAGILAVLTHNQPWAQMIGYAVGVLCFLTIPLVIGDYLYERRRIKRIEDLTGGSDHD